MKLADLIDFLLARLTDDERAADEADMATWEQEEPVRADLGPLSPDRLRRDCKVKRAIVAAMLEVGPEFLTPSLVLKRLASLYAGHEDYDESWRP